MPQSSEQKKSETVIQAQKKRRSNVKNFRDALKYSTENEELYRSSVYNKYKKQINKNYILIPKMKVGYFI